MIISHKHKFIFIKTEKTAGTSIEIALSEFCGDDDIITPISPEDEEIRRQLGHKGPQNINIPLDKLPNRAQNHYLNTKQIPKFYNHMSAAQVRSIIGPDIWNHYYKFCFERNPWDKVISWYYWRHKSEPRPTISDFVHSREANIIKGFDLYTHSSEIIVNKIFFFENLQSAMQEITQKLNFHKTPRLPKTKAKFRKDKRNYREILSTNDKEKIAKVYAREIAFFDYTF